MLNLSARAVHQGIFHLELMLALTYLVFSLQKARKRTRGGNTPEKSRDGGKEIDRQRKG